jgi:hypothetical protein
MSDRAAREVSTMVEIVQPTLDRDRLQFEPVTNAATPFGLMRFRLIFSGELSPNNRDSGNRRVLEKTAIRNQIHPQLEELYQIHPGLRGNTPDDAAKPYQEYMQALREPKSVDGFGFVPLVRESVFLTCSLSITFLRRQVSPLVTPQGDIDNRIKTLLDGLAMPKTGGGIVRADPTKRPSVDPCYVLLEDDKLIAGLSINVDRYLGGPHLTETAVLLLIDVDVRVTELHWSNIGFLSD